MSNVVSMHSKNVTPLGIHQAIIYLSQCPGAPGTRQPGFPSLPIVHWQCHVNS